MKNSDRIMRQTFWIGVYPGINDDAVGYVLDVFNDFCRDAGRA